MCPQSSAEQDSPVAVNPPIQPRMPWRVTTVEARPGFQLQVQFIDGTEGAVDLSGLIQSPRAGVFARLADPAVFAQVFIEHGAVTWPGEIDLAPDTMHAEIKRVGTWALR